MKRLMMLAICAAFASAAPASARADDVSPAAASDAEQHFNRGIKLFDDGDFKLALVEFERSYDLVPNFHVLYNIGEVQFQLNQYAHAWRTLSRYVEVGGERILPNRRADVARDLEALKIRTAQLSVNVDVDDAEILVDGERIGRSPLKSSELVDAGGHQVVVQKQGFVAANESLTLAGADDKALAIHLVAVPVKEDRAPVIELRESPGLGPVWIGWGLTVALGIATVATTIAWQNADSKLTDLKDAQSSQNDRESQARSVETLRTATFIVGAGGLVAGGVSLWLTLRHGSDPKTPPAKIGLGPGSLLVSGSF